MQWCSQLSLEVLHDIQKQVVHVRFVLELNFHSIEIAEGILDVERAFWRSLADNGPRVQQRRRLGHYDVREVGLHRSRWPSDWFRHRANGGWMMQRQV